MTGTRPFASSTQISNVWNEFARGFFSYYFSGPWSVGDFKKRLFEALWEFFAPMRARRAEILARPGYVDEVLEHGARRARDIADATMERVRAAVGLR